MATWSTNIAAWMCGYKISGNYSKNINKLTVIVVQVASLTHVHTTMYCKYFCFVQYWSPKQLFKFRTNVKNHRKMVLDFPGKKVSVSSPVTTHEKWRKISSLFLNLMPVVVQIFPELISASVTVSRTLKNFRPRRADLSSSSKIVLTKLRSVQVKTKLFYNFLFFCFFFFFIKI